MPCVGDDPAQGISYRAFRLPSSNASLIRLMSMLEAILYFLQISSAVMNPDSNSFMSDK